MTSTEHRFQVDLRGVVDLLSHHLYASPRVFVRELLQNGTDAITARRAVDPDFAGRVVIEPLPDGALRVTDNGIGLTEAEVHTFLASVGRTSSATTLASPGRTTWVSSASDRCPASWPRTPSRWSPARPRGARP